MLWLTACTPDPTAYDPLVFVDPPELVQGDDPDAPLVYRLRATLSRPAGLVVDVSSGRRFELPEAEVHFTVLVGWPAGEHLDVHIASLDGAVAVLRTVDTPPLPPGFPPLAVVASEPDGMEPGDTLFAANRGGTGTESWIVRVDPAGRVVWWLHDPGQVLGLAPLDDGNLAYLTDKATLRVVDPEGREIRAWHAEGHGEPDLPGVPALYHDLVALPDGAFAVVSFELREVTGYPSSERDPTAPPAPATVVSTTVLELDAAGVRSTLRLGDLLDPLRIGYDGVAGTYWDSWLPDVDDPKDWGHGNGLFYDPVEDRLLISLRNQDAVLSVPRETGEVQWVVAPEANWRAPWDARVLAWIDSPGGPAYHAHGPNLTAEGTLLLFDNGNGRASVGERPLPDARNASRALELRVDPVAGTVSELWEYGPDREDRPFCVSHGGAEALDRTHHVLVTFGHVQDAPPGAPTARIVEVDRTGHVFFELGVGGGEDPEWTVFRALRLIAPDA